MSSIVCAREPVARGLVAIDSQRQGRARGLLIGGDVAQLRQGLHLGEHPRRPVVQLIEIGILHRVLILRARGRGRRRARPGPPAGTVSAPSTLASWRPQSRDDLVRGRARVRRAASE